MLFDCEKPRKGLILHSGAIGDCLLTLPLAAFVKQRCGLTQVHFMGRPEAVGVYPRRSAIDHVRPLESVPLHRLFEPQSEFFLDDPDRLIAAFGGYEYIVSFLGADHADFEQNLILTVHCSHAAEVTLLPMTPPNNETKESVGLFYIRRFAESLGLDVPDIDLATPFLTAAPDDPLAGQDFLEQLGVDPDARVAVVHPGSGGRHKCWHPENFLDLVAKLRDGGAEPVVLFGPAEQERFSPAIQEQFRSVAPVAADLTLTQTFQLLTQADVFVGNDSGISHLAGAMGKKTVALFGPTDATLYRPLGPHVTIVHPAAESFAAPCPNAAARLLEQVLTEIPL